MKNWQSILLSVVLLGVLGFTGRTIWVWHEEDLQWDAQSKQATDRLNKLTTCYTLHWTDSMPDDLKDYCKKIIDDNNAQVRIDTQRDAQHMREELNGPQ